MTVVACVRACKRFCLHADVHDDDDAGGNDSRSDCGD